MFDRFGQKMKSLREEEGGAIMLVSIFMAIFLVGLLYYTVAIGDAILYKEKMQDAADVGAFTGAVVNARGMNFLTFFNLIMAVVMSIVIALKTIEILLLVAYWIVFALSKWPPLAALEAVAQALDKAHDLVEEVTEQVEDFAEEIIGVCKDAQKIVKTAWPIAAQGRSVWAMTFQPEFSPPSKFGFIYMYPSVIANLPVEDHKFSETCDRGVRLVRYYLDDALGFLPGGELVSGIIGGGFEAAAQGVAAYYCEGDASNLPSYNEEVDRLYPRFSALDSCDYKCEYNENSGRYVRHPSCVSCGSPTDAECSEAVLERICRDARSVIPGVTQNVGTYNPAVKEIKESEEASHGCIDAGDIDGCEKNRLKARETCNRHFDRFTYLKEKRYLLVGKDDFGQCFVYAPTGEEAAVAEVRDATIVVGSDKNPCRGIGWDNDHGDLDSEPIESFCEITPFLGVDGSITRNPINRLYNKCQNEAGAPSMAAMRAYFDNGLKTPLGGISKITFDKYAYRTKLELPTEIYQCSRKEELSVSYDIEGEEPFVTSPENQDEQSGETDTDVDGGEGESESDEKWKPPYRVKEGLWLGDKRFEIRAFVIGNQQNADAQQSRLKKMLKATDDQDPNDLQRTLQYIGKFSVAQAEFFWNGWAKQSSNNRPPKTEDMKEMVIEGRSEIEWMWDIRWRGRLKMFNIPLDADNLEDSCDSDCDGFGDTILRRNILFSH